jgi:iron complex outermembrane receptor protein
VGNASLKAEYSWQADLGIDVNTTCLSAQASLFANRIGNYIFAQRIDEIREEEYQTYQYTQGDARLLGFEAGVDFHPIHSLHFANTFAYVDARQMHVEEDARHLPMTPAPRWASELKYEITHHGHAALNNAFVSMELECYLAQNNYYKVDDTETRTPAYGLLNISAGTDLNIKRKKIAELYIAVDNLLDKAYQNHLSRLKYCDINNATGRQGVYNMGRNVIFKIVIPIETKI